MKKYLVLALFTLHFSLFTSCGGPKVIPDEKLAEIFRDVYLTNAVAQERAGLKLDSLSIYEPLLERHGYTGEDLQYTLGNFAKRKSASISRDIVGRALELLRTEGRTYTLGIAARDSITRIAREKFSRRVETPREMDVRRIADTARMRIVLPAEAGSYRVEFGYEVDSLDENLFVPLRVALSVVGAKGRNLASTSYRLGRTGHGSASMEVKADTAARRLVLDLNPYPTRDLKRPYLTIDSLRLTHYLPDEVAFDSIQREMFNYFARSWSTRGR